MVVFEGRNVIAAFLADDRRRVLGIGVQPGGNDGDVFQRHGVQQFVAPGHFVAFAARSGGHHGRGHAYVQIQ